MTTADAALVGLCRELTVELMSHQLMLTEVRGYERVEHGKLEHVRAAVRNYMNAAGSINRMLRSGHPDPYDSEAELHQRTVAVLDRAFSPLPQNRVVWRGVPDHPYPLSSGSRVA